MKRFGPLAAAGLAVMLLGVAFATAGEREVATAAGGPPPPITIGLFLPQAGPLAATGEEVSRGVAVAVHRANAEGGIDGRPIRVVSAASDRLWEGASGELVRLIYDAGAVAVIGALDGRSAHLAEQVITRARGAALFITPWASETTLTRIRVPWFFRLVPDDRQQAEVLAQELFVALGLRRIAVWTGGGFDGRSAAAEFRRVSPAGAIEEFGLAADVPAALQRLLARIAAGAVEAVVMFAAPEAAGDVVAALRAAGSVPPLFGPLDLARASIPEALSAEDELALIAPGEVAPERFGFARQYRDIHEAAPGFPALYGHDAATAVIEALRTTGADGGDRLAAVLSGLSFQGVTGEVRFNDQGGRDLMPVLATTRRGTPVARRGAGDPAER